MAKPYSFRFPYDIRSTLEPWRQQLSDTNVLDGGSGGFDPVIAQLADRDRAIEDYLSLGVAQGYLGLAYAAVGNIALTGSYADLAGLSVSFTVPAGRKILVAAHVRVIATSGPPVTTQVRILNQANAALISDYYYHGGVGVAAGVHMYNMPVFWTPAAGTHTVRVQGSFVAGTASVETLGTDIGTSTTTFISVEDVGPATR